MRERERFFPLLPWKKTPRIPWEMVEPHARQAEINHYQTLERLAERGGLSPSELMAVLEDRRWSPMPDASEKLDAAIEAWRQHKGFPR